MQYDGPYRRLRLGCPQNQSRCNCDAPHMEKGVYNTGPIARTHVRARRDQPVIQRGAMTTKPLFMAALASACFLAAAQDAPRPKNTYHSSGGASSATRL